MILDLNQFITAEQPFWEELESILNQMQKDAGFRLDMKGIKRFHYLYQRTSSSLARLTGFSMDQELKRYLESLVGRAFSRIHENRVKPDRLRIFKWFLITFPGTFRKHIMAFWLSLAIMTAGSAFGVIAIAVDKDAKSALMPFSHLMQDPAERVAREESRVNKNLENSKSQFAGFLMSNNIKVSILAMGLGMSWGIGTIIVLFGNGVFLGATVADYIFAGQTKFLVGWLLPHGSIEIPAILLAGQAGLVLAGALIGWGKPVSIHTRFRKVIPDLVSLMGGVSLMLIWAGVIEAFLSQYHEPLISYDIKIMFGGLQLILLCVFLSRSGRMKGHPGGE